MLSPNSDKLIQTNHLKEQKQIEEIADILCESKEHNCNGEDCKCLKQATDLFNKGARIFPKDSVALSVEEFKKYIFIKQNIEQSGILGWIKEEKEKERKETAEKILEKGKYNMPEWLKDWIVEQFGIEIKESGDE